MEHSKTGTTVSQTVTVRNPNTVKEIDVNYGDVFIQCFTWRLQPNKHLSQCNYKATIILPEAHLSYWSSEDEIEFTKHKSFTLSDQMKRVVNQDQLDYLRKRILTSLRMNLANVEAHCKPS